MGEHRVAARPPHRSPPLLLGVLVGGAAGTGLRYAAALVLPPDLGAWPWATFVVNVVGALVLGVLLEALVRGGPDVGRRRAARLVLGSGLLGALTTTSALALETVRLGEAASSALAAAYAGTTLVAGVCAAGLGVALAASASGRWTALRGRR